jgi:crossover junction endodeoxyribonuclease RuvC
MTVLAVDPGYGRIGFAVLARPKQGKEILHYSDCFTTPKELAFFERLKLVGEETNRLIECFKPEALAIETLFFNTNQKTALHVAEARGAILYLAMAHGLRIYEYTPLQVKIAVTGYGRGTKSQVITMVHRLVQLEEHARHDDEYDAIAIGLTCLASVRD